MARLPQPGSDQGQWGEILNEYLLVSHSATGALNAGSVTNLSIADGAIDNSKLAPSVQTTLAAAASAVSSVNGRTGAVVLTKSDVGLGNVDNTSDATKPISTATQTALDAKSDVVHTHTVSQISDATPLGRAVMTSADAAAAQSALGIANTVQVVDSFSEVTTPVYGTLYVVRS